VTHTQDAPRVNINSVQTGEIMSEAAAARTSLMVTPLIVERASLTMALAVRGKM
jgi:hypothetical protein